MIYFDLPGNIELISAVFPVQKYGHNCIQIRFISEVGGHGHEKNGHRCPCPRHGHGHGHGKFENRDLDIDVVRSHHVI